MSFLNWLFNIFADPLHKPTTSDRSDTSISSLKVVSGDLQMATMKITNMLNCSGENFCTIFSAIECAENPGELEEGLERFNKMFRILFTAAPQIDHNRLLLETLKNYRCSQRFESYIHSTATVKDAVIGYKTDIVKKLKIDFQRREEFARQDKSFDKALLACYMTKQNPEIPHAKPTITRLSFAEDDPNTELNENNKVERTNKHSWETQRNFDGHLCNKKRKLKELRPDSEDERVCPSYKRGTCRRGSRCWYKH